MRTRRLGDGKFWMGYWTICLAVVAIWGALTFLFWLDSVPNLNALSIAALLIGCGGGFQASLGMRKADPEDKL